MKHAFGLGLGRGSVWLWLTLAATAACTFNEQARQCTSATQREDCGPYRACYRGFCIAEDNPGGSTDAGVSPSPDSAVDTPPTCEPKPETCNGVDDDCDGKLDEQPAVTCYPEGASGCPEPQSGRCVGACSLGTRACVDGALQTCAGAIVPAEETCTDASGRTATDEDCDGQVDEQCECASGSTLACYDGPQGTQGVGACKAGAQRCVDATFQACEDAVKPRAETCANAGSDDDCNGQVDDVKGLGDPCQATGSQGICRNGTSSCKSGSAELVCVPAPAGSETCNRLDDDCDGVVDNGFDLQTDPENCGSCATRCAANESCLAGQCRGAGPAGSGAAGSGSGGRGGSGAGMPAAGTGNAGTPAAGSGGSGGSAGNPPNACDRCGPGQECCDGRCVDTRSDPDHCGSCTNRCERGKRTGCCASACVDLTANATCGSCDNHCGVLTGSNTGRTCSCENVSGELRCVGAVAADVCIL